MKINTLRQEGYQLLQEGCEALAQVEANGIRIDLSKMSVTKARMGQSIHELRGELQQDSIWKNWKRKYGDRASLTSRDQLAEVLFTDMGYPVVDRTEKGKPSTDEEALSKIPLSFVQTLVRYSKFEKALNTFIKGIENEVVGDRLHPVFNLHLVLSYRSSSDSPNFQNFPVRDKEIAEIIRDLFIPSAGCILGENDFKGIEVGMSASYHLDPTFIDYITTPGKDMHRDMAAQIYCLDPEQVSKDTRYGAKNKFVFPQFYGDWYLRCAQNLWEWAEKGHLKGPDGQTMLEHLKSCGIRKLGKCDPEQKPVSGTFEHHIKKIEQDFWENRFRVYGEWRKQFYADYLKNGFFDLKTGFRVYGSFNRKQVCNFPIQGSAFHCLLWSLIQVNKAVKKYRMGTMLVGQIHDSMLSDIKTSELPNYWEIVEHTVNIRLPKHYPWLAVPMEIEYEATPSIASWFHKTEVKFKDGRFLHPTKPDRFTKNGDLFVSLLDQNHYERIQQKVSSAKN